MLRPHPPASVNPPPPPRLAHPLADCQRATANLAALAEHLLPTQIQDLCSAAEASSSSGRKQHAVRRLLSDGDLQSWTGFLVSGLGMKSDAFLRLLLHCPEALLESTPYDMGRAVQQLRRLGVVSTDEDLLDRIVPCYPMLLATPPAQVGGAAERLADEECSARRLSCDDEGSRSLGVGIGEAAARRLIRMCPAYLLPQIERELDPALKRIRASNYNK